LIGDSAGDFDKVFFRGSGHSRGSWKVQRYPNKERFFSVGVTEAILALNATEIRAIDQP